jgi:predicted RNA-binding protein with PUA-like domain
VASKSYPDPSQFVKGGKHFDKAASMDSPRWWLVEVEFVEKFPNFVPLSTLREDPALEGMWLLKKGRRLSVQPVDKSHFKHIVRLGAGKTRIR